MKVWTQLVWLAATFTKPDSLPQAEASDSVVKNIFNVVLSLAGAIAVAFIVYAGIQYSLSLGDAGKVKKAKDSILYSLVGLIIVMISFMLVNFVIGKF